MGENGTALYRDIIEHDYGNSDTQALMRKVWSPTPWVITVKDFEPNSSEWFNFVEWACIEIGPESWPIHDRPGDWYRAGATINGRTNYGFSSEEAMEKFTARYPDRVTPND